jgi:hypothetical protein
MRMEAGWAGRVAANGGTPPPLMLDAGAPPGMRAYLAEVARLLGTSVVERPASPDPGGGT